MYTGCGDVLFYLSERVSNFHLLAKYGFVNCQNVSLYFFITLSFGYPIVVFDPLFS